jgi:hypothetical protein
MSSEAAATAAAPNPAPAAAPTTPAAAPPAAKGAPTAAPKQPGAQPGSPPPARRPREPVLWKNGEAEVDVAPFLESYEREITIDGKKHRVHVDDAYAEFSKGRVADRRLSELDTERRKFSQERASFQQQIAMLTIDPKDPTSEHRALDFGARLLSKKFGPERYESFVVQEFARLAKLAKMPEHERAAALREQQLREDLDNRELQVRTKEAQLRQKEEREAAQQRKANIERAKKEWPPLLLESGCPEAWAGRGLQLMAAQLSAARKNKYEMSEAQAARIVGKKLAREAEALKTPAQAALEQPGRETPPAGKQQPPKGSYRAKEEPVVRPDDVRKLWGG